MLKNGSQSALRTTILAEIDSKLHLQLGLQAFEQYQRNSKQKPPIFPPTNPSTAPFSPCESCPIWVLSPGRARLGTTIRTSSEGRSRGKLFWEFSWNENWTCKRHLFFRIFETNLLHMHDFQMTSLFGTTKFPKDPRPENDGKPTMESVHETVSRIAWKRIDLLNKETRGPRGRTRVLRNVGYH